MPIGDAEARCAGLRMAALGPQTVSERLLGLDSVLPLLGVLARAGQPVLIERSALICACGVG